MDIIEDKQQLLNLHHYEIYFIYSENDADLYKQIIKKMNSLPSIKRGIFHFNAIKRGEQSFEKLPDLLQKQLEQKNVLIRLIDSAHGNYSYGMELIDFNNDAETIYKDVEDFINQVCRQNINHLERLKSRTTAISRSRIQGYIDDGIVTEIFSKALNKEQQVVFKGDIDAKTVEDESKSASRKESFKFAEGMADNDKASELTRDIDGRTEPIHKVKLSVTFNHKVPTGTITKRGRVKLGHGLILNIEDQEIPIHLPSTTQYMIYALVLICKKKNDSLYLSRSDFKGPKATSIFEIMEQVYEKSHFSHDSFDDWFGKQKNNGLRSVSNAKSSLNNKIHTALKEAGWLNDAYYYCAVNTKKNNRDDSRFVIKLSASNINLPKELDELQL